MNSHRKWAVAWWIVACVFVAAGAGQTSWSWLTPLVWAGWLACLWMAVLNGIWAEQHERRKTIV